MNGETGGTQGGRGVLGARAHGVVDYVNVLIFLLAPTLFDFGGWPAAISYILAAVHLLLTLSTRFPLGMFDAVPLRAHGVIELVVGILLIALPWILGDLFIEPGGQWFFVGMGVLIFVVWVLSDYAHGPTAHGAGTGATAAAATSADRPPPSPSADRGDAEATGPLHERPPHDDEPHDRPTTDRGDPLA